jgi:hypothetical protein
MSAMTDQSKVIADLAEPANLRFLRRLVTTLTATMILGLLAIFTVLVIRLQPTNEVFPEILALPKKIEVLSISRTSSEVIVISQNKIIYVLSVDGKKLLQTFQIK